MDMIRIGNKVINPSAIAYIDLERDFGDGEPPAVAIYFVGPHGEQGRDIYFDGEAAEALRRKFGNITDLL